MLADMDERQVDIDKYYVVSVAASGGVRSPLMVVRDKEEMRMLMREVDGKVFTVRLHGVVHMSDYAVISLDEEVAHA